ncbi:hypothetical protein ACFL3Q_08870 [Planctomycetota bacterium]
MKTLRSPSVSTAYEDPFPYMTECPKCHMFWPDEYVPLFCPECDSRVSYKAGDGMQDMVRLIEEGKLPINILQCPRCKLRYPQVSDRKLRKCFRCKLPLVNATPTRNFLRKIFFHWRSFPWSLFRKLV